MTNVRVVADAALWQNNMLPEGVVVRWLISDGELAFEGHRIVEIRVEGALHEIIAPATGRLKIETKPLAVIEPGSLLATLQVESAAVLDP